MKKSLFIAVCLLNSFFAVCQPLIPVSVIEINPEVVCPGDSVKIKYVLDQQVQPNTYFSVGVYFSSNIGTIFDTIFKGNLSNLVCVDTLQIGYLYESKLRLPQSLIAGQYCASGNINKNHTFCILVSNKCASPCDSIVPLTYSTGSHTFCTPGTYNPGYSNATWVRITPLNCDTTTCIWTVNNGTPTQTANIIFTPSTAGITQFSLTATQHYNGFDCPQIISWTFTTVVCKATVTSVGIEEYNNQLNSVITYYNIYGRKTEPEPNQLLAEYINGTFVRKVIFEVKP